MFPRSRWPGRRLVIILAGLWLAVPVAVPQAQAAEPARVVVRSENRPDGGLQVTAVVMDAQGAPVDDVPVVFKVRTTFGWLPVGQGSTDGSGRAQAALPAALRPGEIAVEAGEDAQLRATLRLSRGNPAVPRIRPGRDVFSDMSPQPGLISPYPVPLLVLLLAVVLGGIWTTYGYVVWLLSRIRADI